MNSNRRQSLALVALVFLLGSLVSDCGAQVEDFVDAKPSIKSMDPVNPGELLVEWAWSVKETPKDDWIVFLHLRKSGVEGAEAIPVGDYTPNLPTSKWPRGKTVKEFAPARYPAELSGKFDVLVGLYQRNRPSRAALDCAMDPERRFLAGELEIGEGRVKFTPSK